MEQDLITARVQQKAPLNRDEREHGCGVPILGPSPDTIDANIPLQLSQIGALANHGIPFRFMFPPRSARAQAHFMSSNDAGASAQTIRNTVKQAAERAELGKPPSRDLQHASLSLLSNAGFSHADISSSADC